MFQRQQCLQIMLKVILHNLFYANIVGNKIEDTEGL